MRDTAKFFGYMLLFVLAACTRPHGVIAAELVVPPVEANGALVKIPVKVGSAENLAGVRFILRYDPKWLAYDHAEKPRYAAQFMHAVNDKNPGILVVVMAGAKGIDTDGSPILYLYFRAKSTTASRVETDLSLHDVELMSANLKRLPCAARAHPVTLPPSPPEAPKAKPVK